METWTTATDRPDYRCKTIQRGHATIVIYRPILGEAEAAKAMQKARSGLESGLRDHYHRKPSAAAV